MKAVKHLGNSKALVLDGFMVKFSKDVGNILKQDIICSDTFEKGIWILALWNFHLPHSKETENSKVEIIAP